ncbi:MAG TPA: zinc-dependent dehydrogenase [Alphaproteobacteria bacterium]|nr:zinc-dependent dehydrogenase [Alphaproteobacteria bacterium]
MQTATRTESGFTPTAIPAKMQAAVYYGKGDVRLETVPVPKIGAGEILVRVHTCGICGTDLKKIATGSHSAPRIFGHETAGQIVAMGNGVRNFKIGDRVMVFHHIPCGECFYCRHKVFAQCPIYKKVGAPAGFEPSGGGFAEYVQVMDWIVRRGVVKLPESVSYEQASFVEPINTCMKGIETLNIQRGETVLVIGQGPIGIMLALLAKRAGATVVTSDLYAQRLKISERYGLRYNVDASKGDPMVMVRELTEGRGADVVILATAGNSLIRAAVDAARPGGKVMLFAQTQRSEAAIDPAAICVDEKTLLGSYSASVDLQEDNVKLVFSGELDFARLITHRYPLGQAVEALHRAAHPGPESMKVVIQPGIDWEKSQ